MNVIVRSKGWRRLLFVFGTEDRRFIKPSVPKITEDCRRPKTEGYGRKSHTSKPGMTYLNLTAASRDSYCFCKSANSFTL